MKWKVFSKYLFVLGLLVLAFASVSVAQILPNLDRQITPLAPTDASFIPLNPGLSDNPTWLAGQAVTSAVSPNGKTLLVLISGYNLVKYTSGVNEGDVDTPDSTQFVFVFDISQHQPVQTQVIQVPNTYNGIVFDPSGTAFYVTGGVDDDVHLYSLVAGVWAEQAGSPIALGHTAGVGLEVSPQAAGIAITADGNTLVVTNYYNDSISILAKSSSGWALTHEFDLRPGKENPAQSGVPGGEYPLWVVIKGNSTAYVSSIRDREIDVVDILGSPSLITRIPVPGEPQKMVLNASQSTLYVAQDLTDSVAVIDTNSNQLVDNIPVTAPAGLLPGWRSNFKGNNTNSVALSKDEKTLYVTNGAMNDVAVVQLGAPKFSQVVGLIPTGDYPNYVSVSLDGKFMYVVNYKSPTGPNPGYCKIGGVTNRDQAECLASNQYALQLIKAGLQSFPIPTPPQLVGLTAQVAANNYFDRTLSTEEQSKLAFLHGHIHHIIYIIRENRTYDQILGDLDVGNGDPSLTEFGSAATPNQHNLASQFVDLDNFYDSSEVSMDGWPWSTSAHATDVVEKQVTVEYAGRGLTYDSEGTNRNVNVGYPTLAQRLAANPLTPDDPDVLPGTADTAAPDGPEGQEGGGFLWDGALRAGLSIRNYGFFVDEARYNLPPPYTALSIPELTDPFATNTVVSYITSPVLRPLSDPYFRGFDMTFPDYYRFTEWQRDFNANYASGGLPSLELVRIPHDHTGNYSTALDAINTPELDQADCDYAVGLLVQTIANSRYAKDTLIFIIEDDAQDGGDHVDAHRSIAYVVGPYVKHGAVVSHLYNTLSMYRTIEDILGIQHSNLNDSLAVPMTDVFDTQQATWTFTATPSDYLYSTTLPLPPMAAGHHILYSTHDASYWAKVTEGMDFSMEDRLDGQKYNRILWKGLMGNKPYPSTPTGLDLRENRAELLKQYRSQLEKEAEHSADNTTPTAGTGK